MCRRCLFFLSLLYFFSLLFSFVTKLVLLLLVRGSFLFCALSFRRCPPTHTLLLCKRERRARSIAYEREFHRRGKNNKTGKRVNEFRSSWCASLFYSCRLFREDRKEKSETKTKKEALRKRVPLCSHTVSEASECEAHGCILMFIYLLVLWFVRHSHFSLAWNAEMPRWRSRT